MITIKVSDDTAKRMGIASADDFDKRISALLDSEASASARDVTQVNDLKALVSRIAAVEASVLGLPDFGAIKAEAIKASVEASKADAKVEASRVAMEIYSKAGNPPAGDKEGADVTRSKAAVIALNDYAAQYDASEDLQAEFPTKATYVAFAQADAAGRVRISNKSTK